MRSVLFAAALLIGTAAYAQDTGGTQGSGDMQGSGTAATGATVAPSNEAPKRDARGIPVISAPASAPAGWNQPPGTPGAAPASATPAPEGSAGPLPPCSRKVTDNCVQTYERHHGDTGTATAAGGMADTGTAAATTDETAAADTGAHSGRKAVHHRRRHHRR